MIESPSGMHHRQELVRVIQEVRRRWRRKLLLRGAVAIVGGGLLALVLASLALQTLRFSTASVLGFRFAILAVFAALVGWCFVRPLRRRVSDMQVALYVEEHDKSLQAAIMSAVETIRMILRIGALAVSSRFSPATH
jgi:integral membrane sensor domain MASE1